jgi:xanthosine phosphorylase
MTDTDKSPSPAHVAAAVIAERAPGFKPLIGLILGSGLGPLAESLTDSISIPYDELPGFNRSTVVGHKGALVLGYYKGVPVVCMTGRTHLYEGVSPASLAVPVRTMHLMGAEILLATNASGSLKQEIAPGSILVVNDHISFLGFNPLIGPNDESFGPRFVSMHDVYDLELREQMKAAAAELSTEVHEGVYIALTGPTFESPAEVRALHTLGGDVVGMSTVPEVIIARHCGMRAAAVSIVTNHAGQGESHDLTLATSRETIPRVRPVIERWIEIVGAAHSQAGNNATTAEGEITSFTHA